MQDSDDPFERALEFRESEEFIGQRRDALIVKNTALENSVSNTPSPTLTEEIKIHDKSPTPERPVTMSDMDSSLMQKSPSFDAFPELTQKLNYIGKPSELIPMR